LRRNYQDAAGHNPSLLFTRTFVYDIRLLKGAGDVLGGFAPTFYLGDRVWENE
jgi:hypothetical protein